MSKLVFKRILLGFVFGLIGFITLGIIVGPPTSKTPPAVPVAIASDRQNAEMRRYLERRRAEVVAAIEDCNEKRRTAFSHVFRADDFINCANNVFALANKFHALIRNTPYEIQYRFTDDRVFAELKEQVRQATANYLRASGK